MNRYNYFKRFFFSFFSKDLYVFVGREKHKTGFRYLLLLIAIFWIPSLIKMQLEISSSIKKELPEFIEQIPNITISNGIASFDKPSPCIIRDDKTGKEILIFDSSGKYTSLEESEAQILVTDTKCIFKKNRMETREYSFSSIGDFTLTHEKILSWAGWGNYLCILFYLLIIPFALMYRAFLALIYTLIGLIFQAILQTKFSFRTIYRLSILAMTPAYILGKMLDLFDVDFTGWSLMCFIICLGYLFFAMLANKEADKELMAVSSVV